MDNNEDTTLTSIRKDIINLFTNLFKSNGLGLFDYITKNTWFLMNGKLNKSNKTEREQNAIDIMLRTIGNLANEIESNSYPNEIEDIYIVVDKFIYYFVDNILLDYRSKINQYSSKIDSLKINKHLQILPTVISKLKEMKIKEENSFLSVSLMRMENFTPSQYNIKIVVKYSDKSINNFEQKAIVAKEGICSFQETVFPKIHFSSYNTLTGEKTVMNYSGTSLNKYYIVIEKEGKIIHKFPELFFIHHFIKLIDDISDLSKQSIYDTMLFEDQNGKIIFLFEYSFDSEARLSIINEISYHFQNLINEKNAYSTLVNDVLSLYFPEISDNVKCILNQEKRERTQCCSDCLIC